MAKQDDAKRQQPKGGKPQQQSQAQSKGKGQQQAQAKSRPQAEPAREPEDGQRDGKHDGQVAGERYVSRLREKYTTEVTPGLVRDFGYANPMQVPQVKKVVINIGMGSEARENAKSLDNAVGDLGTITGQKAVITRAKKSIAAFKLRTGMPIGVMVTLRGNRMYDFLDKLFNVAMARVRDFSGVSPQSFDGHGNFTLGLREQLIFPEIDYDKIDRIRGMEVVIVTSANTDEEGRRLLELLGMPFSRG